jgi:drug/metabolite transporter (DMT)-like permease
LRWLKDEDSAWLIALNHLVTALVMAPFALQKDLLPGIPLLLLLAAFGMFQMGLPYFLFATGLKTTPSHLASVIALLEPILLPVWIWVAWRHTPGYEPVPWWTMIGAGLILSGMLIRFVPWPGLSDPKSE